ncbi:hypothetical protein [Hymenobacter yonginensis]|uniref:Anti sigma-E protein RseA N-terminal domain-containing protein n=1 Tax=Hymenobacter yonginensis TaxID=748197 RepID=A0ABY7PLK1_9BACT|nr:hypothetical protein [Hymenobacter yonginensis]WBO83666.1 hypothetical protein O9Z63_14950 [Hymenobacter yonginensis]
MSYDDPEEELLDQHLREAFSEFELPPASRVWQGVEGRIGGLPGTAKSLMPLKLLLPAIALAGVAAGWLLPRPAATLPAAKPAAAQVAPVQTVQPTSLPDVLAPTALASTPAGSSSAVAARPRRQLRAVPSNLAERAAPVDQLTYQSTTLAAAAEAHDIILPVPEADSNAALSTAPRSRTASADPVVAGTEPTTDATKAESPRGFHTEFRQPTHRRAEKGRSIRRRLSAVGQWMRHLVSPRRVRTTGQPSF